MNEQEKKKINDIADRIAAISGGLQGVILASRDRFAKDNVFKYSYDLLKIVGELNEIKDGKSKMTKVEEAI